jgi:hypothetical protein
MAVAQAMDEVNSSLFVPLRRDFWFATFGLAKVHPKDAMKRGRVSCKEEEVAL